jgi:CO dehydrogenase/acetyl-CoA synthase beta subunit
LVSKRIGRNLEGEITMAGKKLSLKLKKKEPEAAAPAAAASAAVGASAPAFAMPAGGSGGMVLELKGANISIKEVVIKPKSAKGK